MRHFDCSNSHLTMLLSTTSGVRLVREARLWCCCPSLLPLRVVLVAGETRFRHAVLDDDVLFFVIVLLMKKRKQSDQSDQIDGSDESDESDESDHYTGRVRVDNYSMHAFLIASSSQHPLK